MLTIVNNVIYVDLLVQEKRHVSFMYFCTHENINVIISTGRTYRYLPSFKSKLQQKYFQPKTVPSYFSFGDRYLSVLHARLRNKCSSLNSDLFKSNLVPRASCSCGYKNECSEHFLGKFFLSNFC
jgi:hypothetical protein